MIKLKFENEIISGEKSANIVIAGKNAGKTIEIETDCKYLWLCLEGIKEKAIIYIPNGKYEFTVPAGEFAAAFESGRFEKEFTLSAAVATEEEIRTRRNIALNPLDVQFDSEITKFDAEEYVNPVDSAAIENNEVLGFPHIYGNRITRHEGCFFARNVIDGINTLGSHGDYPYHSWGTSQYEDASIIVYFGRKVKVDAILLALRSDYELMENGVEHDTYWTSVTFEFSDGSEEVVHPVKTGEYQEFAFEAREVEWVRLKELIPERRDNFASLNQIKVMGYDI